MRWSIRCAGLGLFLVVILGLTGCPFSTDPVETPPPPPKFKPRTSPENLIFNLKMAYQEREVDPYDSLLSSSFKFYLAEEDQHITDFFTRNEEIEIHDHMFNADLVTALQLTFDMIQTSDVVFDPEKSSDEIDLYTATVTNITLSLTGWTPQQDPGDPIQTYQMVGGASQFWFRQMDWKHENGDPIWKIDEWLELSAGGP